jgi:hypothetical protein
MSSTKIPSVNDTYFQHKVLTKVHGQPTYESLQTLHTEIKANAASVPSTLGGGQYGHLGLIVSDERYATLANTVPWVSPTNPGPFAPPAGGTGPQIEAAKDVWRDLKISFELCQATEKAIISQIVESIDAIYLRALLNRTTGQYASNIRAVLQHLFSTHGKITPQQVKAKESATYHMHYDISQPVDTVFNAIEDLTDLAEHANSPLSAQQMIDLAYVIFAKQPILQQDLRLWNRKPFIDRTWANMLLHFREAQNDLNTLSTAADIYHQQPVHHTANAVTTMADLVAQRLLDALPTLEEPSVAVPTTDAANVVIQQPESSLAAREAALLTHMQEMMTMMRTRTATGGTTPPRIDSTRNTRGGRGGGRNSNRNNDRGNGRTNNERNPRLYCWSHGACAHGSDACNTRQPGHQESATFQNMMGGSTNRCFWLST